MKALAIDSAVTCISLAACDEEKKASVTLDIGMRQSEKLLPAIDYVLAQVDLTPAQLDFVALSGGPGSFTGLRLGFAAAKGLELSAGCPVIAIPTLEAQAQPYASWPGTVLSAIDAKKNRFYVQIFSQGRPLSDALDADVEEIVRQINSKDEVLLVGPDRSLLLERLNAFSSGLKLHQFPHISPAITDALFYLGSRAFAKGDKRLKPYEGPVYLRKSEAEENQR